MAEFHRGDFNPLEAEFLAASLARQQQREAAELEAARRLAEEAEARRQAEEERALEAERREREAQAKLVQERRARRLMAALAVLILGTILLGSSSWLWVKSERYARSAHASKAVLDALDEANRLQAEAKASGSDPAKVGEAIAITRRASLQPDAAEDVIAHANELLTKLQAEQDSELMRIREAERDQRMLKRLEDIRLVKIELDKQGEFDVARVDAEYAKAFEEYGIPIDHTEPEKAVTLIRQRPISLQLGAALTDWLVVQAGLSEREQSRSETINVLSPLRGWIRRWKMLQLVQDVDPDTWRVRLRSAMWR